MKSKKIYEKHRPPRAFNPLDYPEPAWLRSPGRSVLLTYFIPLQNRPLIFKQQASMACLLEHQKKKKKERVSLGGLQRRQKAQVFISVAGVFISFDTSYVFVAVVGGKGASPVLWEVYPRRGRMRKALCKPRSSRRELRQPLLRSRAVEAAPGLSYYSWGRLFKGTLAARCSNAAICRDLWMSCSFFCQMCLPFVFCGGWHPSMPEPSHAEGACGRDRLLESEIGCVGYGRAPGRTPDALAAFMELHLLFTSCRLHWCGDGNCERRLWLGSAVACR